MSKKPGVRQLPDRERQLSLENLPAYGHWRGTAPVGTPTARELFATSFSNLTAEPVSDWRSLDTNNSPASQDSASGGELIDASISAPAPIAGAPPSPQTIDAVLVLSIAPEQQVHLQPAPSDGI